MYFVTDSCFKSKFGNHAENQGDSEMENSNMEKLKNRDYVLVIDKSGSMATKDCPNGKSRWEYVQETTLAMAAKITELDPDGITVVPFASTFKMYENTTAEKVASIFKENEPGGGTTLAPVLNKIFSDYQARKKSLSTKANGEMLLVVTDGEPSDQNEVAKAIIAFGNTLDNADDEYGIGFFQVGKDAGAAAFLKYLDDNLTSKGAKHDIVDCKTFDEIEAIGMTEALTQALTD